MTQINWVRATFTGAMVGGFVWAVILGLALADVPEIPWGARTLTFAFVHQRRCARHQLAAVAS